MAQTIAETKTPVDVADLRVQISPESRDEGSGFRDTQLRLAWEKLQVLAVLALLVGVAFIWHIIKNHG